MGAGGCDSPRLPGTREVKLGCLFTQTTLDEKGHPVRDPLSSSYVATRDTAAGFGGLVYSEAQGRGLSRAEQVIALGDGAPWIWNLAGEHFPSAIQVVDPLCNAAHKGSKTSSTRRPTKAASTS